MLCDAGSAGIVTRPSASGADSVQAPTASCSVTPFASLATTCSGPAREAPGTARIGTRQATTNVNRERCRGMWSRSLGSRRRNGKNPRPAGPRPEAANMEPRGVRPGPDAGMLARRSAPPRPARLQPMRPPLSSCGSSYGLCALLLAVAALSAVNVAAAPAAPPRSVPRRAREPDARAAPDLRRGAPEGDRQLLRRAAAADARDEPAGADRDHGEDARDSRGRHAEGARPLAARRLHGGGPARRLAAALLGLSPAHRRQRGAAVDRRQQ